MGSSRSFHTVLSPILYERRVLDNILSCLGLKWRSQGEADPLQLRKCWTFSRKLKQATAEKGRAQRRELQSLWLMAYGGTSPFIWNRRYWLVVTSTNVASNNVTFHVIKRHHQIDCSGFLINKVIIATKNVFEI